MAQSWHVLACCRFICYDVVAVTLSHWNFGLFVYYVLRLLVQNVKILPQVKGNVTMSAFVDFSTEVEAESAHTAELVLDGKCLRTDYNFRKYVDGILLSFIWSAGWNSGYIIIFFELGV